MNGEETTRDEEMEARAIARVLAGLEGGEVDGGPPDDPAERALVRRYTELLGLLPWGLEPAAPPPGAADRLLQRVRREGARRPGAEAGESAAAAPALPFPGRAPRRAPRRAPPPRRRWVAPLAAGLAIALLGLTIALLVQVDRQRRTIDDLATRVGELGQRLGAVDDVGAELASLRQRLTVVTEPRVEICPLRAMSDEPSLADARGVLYVSGDHERWFLTLAGLDPEVEGVYRLWFRSAEGPVSAGVLQVSPEGRLEAGSDRMPRGAQAVFVTLEADMAGEEPRGPMVLFGDEAMNLL